MFTRKKTPESEVPLWKEGKEAIIKWFQGLPEMTRRNRTFKNKLILSFMDMLETRGLETPPKDFFRELLPKTLNYDLKDFSYKDSALEMLETIRKVYITLARYSQLREQALWKAIRTIFVGKSQDFEGQFKRWMSRIPGTLAVENLSMDARFLLKTEPEGDLKFQFLSEFPERMGLRRFNQWETDKTLEYLARLSKARLEIDMSEIIATFTLPTRKEPKLDITRGIFEDIFARFKIPREEQEVYIVELMEKSVWE